MQRQRWEWTYTYGVPLLIAAITAVLLSGWGLVVAVLIFEGNDAAAGPQDLSRTPGPDPTAAPTQTAGPGTSAPPSPEAPGDPACVRGSWRTGYLTETLITGDLVLVDDGPVFTYRDDGTGSIEFGTGVTFEFRPVFGPSVEQEVSGTVEFEYLVQDGQVIHTYLNPLDGATLHLEELGDFPYVPSADTLSYQCGDDGTLTLTAVDMYHAELERLP